MSVTVSVRFSACPTATVVGFPCTLSETRSAAGVWVPDRSTVKASSNAPRFPKAFSTWSRFCRGRPAGTTASRVRTSSR